MPVPSSYRIDLNDRSTKVCATCKHFWAEKLVCIHPTHRFYVGGESMYSHCKDQEAAE